LKRQKLLKAIAQLGAKLVRHGSKHDVYSDGEKSTTIPRHTEIDENLAKDTIKLFSKD